MKVAALEATEIPTEKYLRGPEINSNNEEILHVSSPAQLNLVQES
jgi:hypothetical protein